MRMSQRCLEETDNNNCERVNKGQVIQAEIDLVYFGVELKDQYANRIYASLNS